jgi:hypothetical protein
VHAIRVKAVETVRANFINIEAKDIQPPEIPKPPKCMIILRSIIGLNIPIIKTKGETITIFLIIYMIDIFPYDKRYMGNIKNGIKGAISYLPKDKTVKIKAMVTSSFALGSILCTAVS